MYALFCYFICVKQPTNNQEFLFFVYLNYVNIFIKFGNNNIIYNGLNSLLIDASMTILYILKGSGIIFKMGKGIINYFVLIGYKLHFVRIG